jgi:hypothetical protein
MVYLAETFKFPVTRFSNSVAHYVQLPEARFNPREFGNAVSSIVEKERIDVFVPAHEEIFYVARAVERRPLPCTVWVDTFDKLDMLHNKWTFIECIRKIGLPAPATQKISSRAKLVSLLSDASFEKIVLKPAYSRFAAQTLIWNRGDELPITVQPTEESPWIAQEFVSGRHLCTYSLADKGRVLAHSTYPSQQQWGIGSSTVFECIDHPDAEKWVEEVISRTDFTGQVGFDFIETPEGVLYPIECNPRATSGVHLFNNTKGFVGQFVGDRSKTIVVPRNTELRSVKFALILRLCRMMFAMHPLSEWEKTRRFLYRSKDVFYDKLDPWPVVGQIASLAEILFQSTRLRVSPMRVATYDCDYNGIDESAEDIFE